jgi:hypothetical protein
MNPFSPHTFPLYFPLFFVFMWFRVTTMLGALSGWYALMNRYPDRPESPMLVLRHQSGSFGFVGMSRILVLSACPSGLRIGMMRIFGPFCRDFFVPWDEIRVRRKDRVLWRTAILEFAQQDRPRLSIPDQVANRLARSAADRWPEPGPFPEETDAEAVSRIAKQWLATTTLAAPFFIIAPRIAAPAGAGPPIVIAVLFPAIVFGIGALIQYLRRRSS